MYYVPLNALHIYSTLFLFAGDIVWAYLMWMNPDPVVSSSLDFDLPILRCLLNALRRLHITRLVAHDDIEFLY